MDGSFACPECGSEVEIQGLSPGRHTRCGFCNRLVEIPFIPRVADPSWRRRRFSRSRWVVLAWTALGVALVAIVLAGTSHLMARRALDQRVRTVNRMILSATQRRKAGAFGLALVDLDAAIELAASAYPADPGQVAELKRTRSELARQDGEKILADLIARQDPPASVGEWLNLRARVSKDPDLTPIIAKVEAPFQAYLLRRVESDYGTARLALEARKVGECLDKCIEIEQEVKRLPPDVAEEWRGRLREIVASLVQGSGIIITTTAGTLLDGSDQKTYAPKLVASATKALRAKGYLSSPGGVAWQSLWSRAPFRLNLEVVERREGNYQSSRNRLTRIEVHLTLLNREAPFWQSIPTARSTVPLPKMPAVYSNRLATSPARIDEFERLLYDDARSMIADRLGLALKELPPCPIDPASARTPG